MRLTRLYVVLVILLATLTAFAQPAVQGRLVEVRVTGTTTYADIVTTIVTSRVGTNAQDVDLEAERNRVYSLGTFETVTLTIENAAAGPVLVIAVKENPRIGEIEFEGATSLPSAR